MIRLVKILCAAALLWTGYWFAAGWGLRSGIAAWFTAREAQGWQADYAALDAGGFPLRHVTRITAPALADPTTGTAWRANWLQVESPAIWPGSQTLRFAPSPQRLSYFDQTAVIEAQGMAAELQLAPGAALELERLALTAGPWTVRGAGGDMASAQSLELSLVAAEAPAAYRLTARAEGFAPREALRRKLAAAEDLPERFEMLEVAADVAFDTPWDRRALEQRRPQPRHIALKLAEARWGDLRLKAAGALTVDAAGVPEGRVAIKAENWRGLLTMAETAGVLPPQARGGVERVLELLAGFGGNGEDLDATLTFKGGYVSLGPLPLGPAPRLLLR
ncbi:DUF2125 domain-containing protein [Roseobacteraceae bacterium NS-SX3]